MIHDIEGVVAVMRQRRTADSVLIQQMIQMRDRYNGDVVTPLPDVKGYEAINRPGPNFFIEAIDGAARAANSRLPKIMCPARDPSSERSRERAETRRGALNGRWYTSQLDLKLYRAYRHLIGYGTASMVVLADEVNGCARIELRDPLTAYPELRAPDDVRSPDNVGFLFARSAQWIESNYPGKAPAYLRDASGKAWDTLWDIVEWIDEEKVIIGLMGPKFPPYGYSDQRPFGYTAIELDRYPNKAGMVPAVCPRRVTLDRVQGQMASLTGYTDLFARLMALEIVATEKATFPDMVVMSKNGLMPQLAGGKWKDGRSGEANLVTDAVVEVIGKSPGPTTMPMLQQIGMHIRSTGGASPLYAGDNAGMRTGAGVAAMGDFSIDPTIAEAQHIMERILIELNKGVMAVEKGHFGDTKFTVVMGLAGSQRTVTYTPNKDYDFDETVVDYPFPGADINKLSVGLAQRVSTQMMSKRTARYQDPMIDDPDQEEEWVNEEAVIQAMVEGFASRVAQDPTLLPVAARAVTLMQDRRDLDFPRALLQATAEAASQGPAPGSPEAAAAGPGGGPPGAAGPSPGGPPAGPGGGQIPAGLAQMLASQGAGPQAQPGGAIPAAPPALMNFRHVLQGINEQVSPGAT